MSIESTPAPVSQKQNKLPVTRMPTRSNVRRTEWDVFVPPETTVDDLLNPVFWAHVAGSTFQGKINYVDVHWDDNSQLCRIYVRNYNNSAAQMELLDHWDFDKNTTLDVPDDYIITWSGDQTKYRVIRRSDNQVIRDGFVAKPEALAFIEKLPK